MDLESATTQQTNHSSIDNINPIALLRQPDKMKTTFYELTCQASQAIKNKNYQLTIKCLTKCLQLLDLGRNILKDISQYWRVTIYANIACSYQSQWKIQKSHRYCDKVEEQFKKLLDLGLSKQTQLKIHRHIIRLRFQHCALISQLDKHQKALELCQSTLPKLIHVIKTVLQYSLEVRTNNQQQNSIEVIEFRTQVCDYAEEILKYLLQKLQQKVQISVTKPPFYYWQKNPEKNQEQVKKKFVPNQNQSFKRSILGVNRTKHWIDDFNIGGIMHMTQLTLSDFQNPIPMQEYLFKDQLYELIINCSVAHFTIATEMRFIDSGRKKAAKEELARLKKERRNQQQPNRLNNFEQINIIAKKYGYQQKSQLFKLSEAYHLKAIDIMAHNLKFTVPYIQHLIQSYDKHYIHQKLLEPITAIDQSKLSINDKSQLEQHLQQIKSSTQPRKQLGRFLNEVDDLDLKQVEIQYKNNYQVDHMKPKMIENEVRKVKDLKHQSMGKFKSPKNQRVKKNLEDHKQKDKFPKKKVQKQKIKQTKNIQIDVDRQLRIKHHSMTQIKVIFKKKK